MNRFANKVAAITGGNSGIGLATARLLRNEGAQVAITGRDDKTLRAAAAELGVLAIAADVGNLADLDRAYEEIGSKLGRIDVLFANAGIYKTASLAETTEEFFDEQVAINFKGVFFTVQKALPLLNDGASVVLNSSVVNVKGWAGISVYSATKAAVRSLARSLSAELIGRGIRVNAISPGATFTPIFGRLGLSDEELKATADGILGMVPAKRFGTPEDIAHAVAYLASSDSAYVVGAELAVDGGLAQI